METKDSEFLTRLMATYKTEARDHVGAMSSGLLALEKTTHPDERRTHLETLLREAHSLKGASRAVNQSDVERICQALEEVLSTLKKQEKELSVGVFDDLHRKVDEVGQLLSLSEAIAPAGAPPAARQTKSAPADTLRISTAKLDTLLLQAEEMLSVKMTAHQEAAEVRTIGALLYGWRKEWGKILPELQKERTETSIPLINFLDWNQTYIRSLETLFTSLSKSSERHCMTVSSLVDGLLNDAKNMRVMPFSTLLEIFPKLVRDLSREQGKDVALSLKGQEIEIDRRILEAIKDPLVHLIRNAVDHGIEPPQERVRRGKSPSGTITIAIAQADGNTAEILISDDGAGIDLKSVKNAAVNKKILSAEEAEAMSDADGLALIFQSDVSTRAQVTEISGRGLGLAIVRENVEKLGGRVSVENIASGGAVFRILLPLTLATLRGILTRAAGHVFVIPTANVEGVVKIKLEEVKRAGGKETILFNGQILSLVRLSDILRLPASQAADAAGPSMMMAMVLAAHGQRAAFIVDDVLHEQELLIKSLDKPLSRLRHVAGVTVLASGTPAPILNAGDLLKTLGQGVRSIAAPASKERQTRQKRILLVEDSITSRMFLKNILESAGYHVSTAVDGLDGWTSLRTDAFNLVVSDIDMPRMNGFDLTAMIRKDEKLAESPVILVTSRESKEDRERGVEVGASAYVIKSHFDQAHLLEMIRRLL